MSSALSLMVFGQVYFLGPVSNNPSITPDSNLTSAIYQNHSQPEPTQAVRRNDYTYIPDVGTYKVHRRAADWDTCWRTCKEERGHLVVINSLRESRAVSELARNAGAPIGSNYPDFFHIGIHNRFDQNEWVTIFDETLVAAGFSEWDVGQPDRGDQACGSINYTNGKLDDSACTRLLGFICELP